MNLVLLTFGDKLENHCQAVFCILTFLKDKNISKVIVLTDKKAFYRFLSDHVEIIEITPKQLKEWQGEYQFFWRIKIKALQFLQQQFPDDHLFYVDSDIFLAKHLDEIMDKLNHQQAFMHKQEYFFAEKGNSKTERKMIQVLNHQTFSGVEINEQTPMWNAGVIGPPKAKAKAMIELALTLCDQFCATKSPRRLLEQLAFSVALNHLSDLQHCEGEIGHYWGNKSEWNRQINDFLTQGLLKKYTVSDYIKALEEVDFTVMPINKKQRSTNQKLKALIDHCFPDKNIHYFKY